MVHLLIYFLNYQSNVDQFTIKVASTILLSPFIDKILMLSVETPLTRCCTLFCRKPAFTLMLDCLEQLSIVQIYNNLKSRARKRMPKHVGPGMSPKTVFIQKSSLLCLTIWGIALAMTRLYALAQNGPRPY